MFDKDLLSYSLDLADGNYQGEFLRANVEPELLKRYISQLGLPDSSVLFSETKAKNLVNKRIKQSWRGIVQKVEGSNSAYIGTQQIRSRKAVPMCRGIMLAFYERLVMQGYEKGEFFLNKKENIAFEESFALYRRIAHLLPNTAEKPVLEIKTHFF
ncbi:hypothetical protein HOA92_01100 [archaeon]|nr:hypothetical protein [archaeon]MBT6761615.1 hypothetical protein [archaeon]